MLLPLQVRGRLPRCWRGKRFNDACFNAVRCHSRMCRGSQQAQQQLLAKLEADPEAWRADVLPLVAPPGNRSTSARSAAKQRITSDIEYEKDADVQDALLLTKRRFRSYRVFWDGMASDEASEEWEEKRADQKKKLFNMKGEAVVAGDDNPRQRHEKGTRRDETDNQPDRLGRTSSRGCSTPPRRQFTKEAQSGKRPRFSPDDDDEFGFSDEEDDGLSVAGSGSVRSVRTRFSGASGLTREVLATHDDLGGKPDLKRSRNEGGPETVSAVQLMQEKKVLKDKLMAAHTEVMSRKGIVAMVAAAEKEMNNQHVAQVEKDTTMVLETVKSGAKALQLVIDRIDKVKASGFKALIDESTACTAALAAASKDADEHHEAMQFLIKEDRKHHGAGKNHARYQKVVRPWVAA